MTAAQITARLTFIITPEIERLLREQSDEIADLKQRLEAANTRAEAAEARLEQLRQVFESPTPEKPTTTVKLHDPRTYVNLKDDPIIAAFHERRLASKVSINELASALGMSQSNAYDRYNRWCKRTGTDRVKYGGNGQRVTV